MGFEGWFGMGEMLKYKHCVGESFWADAKKSAPLWGALLGLLSGLFSAFPEGRGEEEQDGEEFETADEHC
ncbi:MAG: hypothetical protein MJZ22_03080, partial [Candidatus Saccharibacteria bacterium]|nr:hypothetical protein [Candidatus Saccharibacteria bacterium]